MTRIAIVGGGIAGLYAAWRLKTSGANGQITVYEATEQAGGRIDTMRFGVRKTGTGEPPHPLSAELGAMRYPHNHQLLTYLCGKLSIPVTTDETYKLAAWTSPFQLKSLWHLRGTTLSEEEFRAGRTPYRLNPEEKGKTPAGLLEYAITSMLDTIIGEIAADPSHDRAKLTFLRDFTQRATRHEPMSTSDWLQFIDHDFEFGGIPLRNIGFWNVLRHFLSSEAFLLVHDGFGFLSVISNWNAPEAFKWLLTDFSPHQKLLSIRGGFGQLVEALTKELGDLVQLNRTLRKIEYSRDGEFRLHFSNGASAAADAVILALPPSALNRVRMFDGDKGIADEVQENWEKLFQSSRPHRLAKVVLAYEEPWWRYTQIPMAESGRLFTDLPMRQIHYFGPRWLAENGWCSPSAQIPNLSLVMVYNDSHYEAFWRTFSVHNKVYNEFHDRRNEHPHKTLGVRPHGIGERLHRFWGPRVMREKAPAQKPYTEVELRQIEDEPDYDRFEVRHRMEEKVRKQLNEIHQYEVPIAIGGVFHDWFRDGGWHTWEPFVDVPAVKEVIAQPFVLEPKINIRKLRSNHPTFRLPLFVCGEAYAWEQGWIEGALMTAERIVHEVLGRSDSCPVPEWFAGGNQSRYDDYMLAELPAARREMLPRGNVRTS